MVSRVAVVCSLTLQQCCSAAAAVLSTMWMPLPLLPSALRRLLFCCVSAGASLVSRRLCFRLHALLPAPVLPRTARTCCREWNTLHACTRWLVPSTTLQDSPWICKRVRKAVAAPAWRYKVTDGNVRHCDDQARCGHGAEAVMISSGKVFKAGPWCCTGRGGGCRGRSTCM